MQLSALTLPDTSMLALLRISLDALMLCIARRHWLRHQDTLEGTFSSRQVPLSGYQKSVFKGVTQAEDSTQTLNGDPVFISSLQPCRITFLRIKLLLNSASSDETFSGGAYIDIEGIGDFDLIVLALPMVVAHVGTRGISDGLACKIDEHGSRLHLMDYRESDKRSEPFRYKTYLDAALPLSQTGANVTLSFPMGRGPFAVGLPMTTARELHYPARNGEPATTVYFPCVERMELSIGKLPKVFAFDPHGQAPFPEFFSDTECRWISGTGDGARPHSSISSRLIHGMGEERLQMSRIRPESSI